MMTSPTTSVHTSIPGALGAILFVEGSYYIVSILDYPEYMELEGNGSRRKYSLGEGTAIRAVTGTMGWGTVEKWMP